jgi:hypothetical protein
MLCLHSEGVEPRSSLLVVQMLSIKNRDSGDND